MTDEQVEKIKDPTKDKLSLKEKISYGFGDFGNGFMFDMGQMYLNKYFIDVCAIPAAISAAVFSVTKIFDAFMDPVAATVIDNKKKIGKAGRFRPVMMIGAILLGFMTVVTFSMPDLSLGFKIFFAYASYMLWGLIYSFTNISYGTLASVMTRDTKERSFLATFRQAGSLGAQLVAGIAFVPIMSFFDDPHVGYQIAAAVMAALGVAAFYVCYRNTREKVPVERESNQKVGFVKSIQILVTNRPLICMILMTLFTISAMNTNNQMMIFFCEYNLGNAGLTSVINFVMIGCSVVGISLIPKLVEKFGKKKTAMGGLLIAIVADALNFFMPTNIAAFMILVTIGYVGLAIPNGVTWAFVTDTIDYGEWHTGIRRAGTTYATFNFARKLAQALAAVVSSGILVATGYVANAAQSEATLLGIKGAMTLYPAIALTLALLTLFFIYNLSDEKYKKVADDLSHGKWEKGELKD